jgi:putative phosphoesterase
MKIAVLADIHGNLPALQTVVEHIESWQPDRVVVAGDIVNRGPRSLACLHLIQDKQQTDDWLVVRGNHEDYVLTHVGQKPSQQKAKDAIHQNSLWTFNRLNGQIAAIAGMPFQVSLPGPDGREVRIVHASMRNNRDGIYNDTSDKALRQQIAPAPSLLCVGHTHRPLIRQLDETLVVNVGSVGMPFDGDRRAGYGQLHWQNGRWQAEIIRLDYDTDQMEQDFYDTRFIPDAGALTSIMLVEFHQARAHLHIWMREYEAAVIEGRITLPEAVRSYLNRLNGNTRLP